MLFKKGNQIWLYMKHDLLILSRYQQIYIYPLIIIILALMPLFLSTKGRNLSLLGLLYPIIIYWLFSPFFLNMLSLSSEDTRSYFLFPLNLRDFVFRRTILNLCLLTMGNSLSIVLTAILFPKMYQDMTEIIVLSMMHLLSAMSMGNLTSLSALSWIGKTTFSWKGGFVLIILNFNIILYKFSRENFSKLAFCSIILTVIFIYMGFYYLSSRKLVKEIFTCFSSIAEK